MTRRVLFIILAKNDGFRVGRIHMGLTVLGAILESMGHVVRVVDYASLRGLAGKINAPPVESVVRDFEPDVVGISVFSYLHRESEEMVDRVSRCTEAPILLGGPHFAVFPEDFANDRRVSYIVRGEAEREIGTLVESARREPRPVIVDSTLPNADEIPAARLDIACGSEFLRSYQIQLSRGCPYGCSFCNVHLIPGRRVRSRDLDRCLAEIVSAKERYPNIDSIYIGDDCPAFDRQRFKGFLRAFRDAHTGCTLHIDNMRADFVDEEFVRLYVAAGGDALCFGVESGDPEILKRTKKGEALGDILRATRLVRKHGLKLGLCFVIGLPGDNLRRHCRSMRLAKALKPDYVFWNMCVPWPGTEVGRWYERHGDVRDLRNFSTLVDKRAGFCEPVASTPEFPRRDRIKAWHDYFRSRSIPTILRLVLSYGLYWSFLVYLARYSRTVRGRLRRALRRVAARFASAARGERGGEMHGP